MVTLDNSVRKSRFFFNLNVTFFNLKLSFFNLNLTFFNLNLTFLNLNQTFFNLNQTFFNLNATFFNLNVTFFNLNVTFFNLNFTFFNLKVKRCSTMKYQSATDPQRIRFNLFQFSYSTMMRGNGKPVRFKCKASTKPRPMFLNGF